MLTKRIYCAVVLASLISAATLAGELSLNSFGMGSRSAFPAKSPLANKPQVQVTLLPESTAVAAGKPFQLIMRFNHAPDAYTYWTNPGGPGQPAKITWRMPPGFLISQPSWPAPQISDGTGLVSYVHKGNTLALFTVTPPASVKPGDKIDIAADIDAQVCTVKTCMPVKLAAATSLVAANSTGTVTPLLERAKNSLPSAMSGWDIQTEKDSQGLALVLTPGDGANPEPGAIYFFDDMAANPLVDSQRPQALEKTDSGYRLLLPTRRDMNPAKLTGLLHSEKGWLDTDGKGSAFKLNLSLDDMNHLAAASGYDTPQNAQDAILLLLFAFVGGLLLNVMPCVFPVISLKVMGFAKQAHHDRRAIFLHGLAYGAGVLLCFWALAILVISLGRGWGAQLQSSIFVYALCILFVAMSLNMAGVFEVGTSAGSMGQALSGRVGLKRSFFTGLLATVTSTPCSAPFLGSALAYALSLPPLLAMGVFTLMGVGFAIPYLLLALFPGLLKRLPKPGEWMETFRQAMSFPLFATAGYMLWTLEGMVDDWRLLMVLFGLVTSAFACWLYGKAQRASHVTRTRKKGRIYTTVAVMFLALGIWIGWPSQPTGLQWREWSPELVRELQSSGKAVYVDFTARWCATCQVNKRVYKDPEVAGLIENKDVVLLKADWTQYDERITRTLKDEFNKAAVPVNALYVPGEDKPRLLPELLTTSNVVEELSVIP